MIIGSGAPRGPAHALNRTSRNGMLGPCGVSRVDAPSLSSHITHEHRAHNIRNQPQLFVPPPAVYISAGGASSSSFFLASSSLRAISSHLSRNCTARGSTASQSGRGERRHDLRRECNPPTSNGAVGAVAGIHRTLRHAQTHRRHGALYRTCSFSALSASTSTPVGAPSVILIKL